MKLVYTYLILTLTFLIAGCGPETTSYDELVERDGITYKAKSETGFTGKAVWLVDGQKKEEVTYKDGKLNGLSTAWFESGQKQAEMTYKDGQKNGLFTLWFESGQKKLEQENKDGEINGRLESWFENGQKKESSVYKNGKLNGKMEWYENGQIKNDEDYMDGYLKKKAINIRTSLWLYETLPQFPYGALV